MVNPNLETAGQIAAIIIGLYLFISVLLFLALQAAVMFASSWIHEKTELLKLLRPQIDMVNEVYKATETGVAPDAHENAVARTVAKVPITLHTADKKVEQVSDRVAVGVIEFRARMVQAETIVKTFFLPGLMKPEEYLTRRDEKPQLQSTNHQSMRERRAPEIPVEAAASKGASNAVEAVERHNVGAR